MKTRALRARIRLFALRPGRHAPRSRVLLPSAEAAAGAATGHRAFFSRSSDGCASTSRETFYELRASSLSVLCATLALLAGCNKEPASPPPPTGAAPSTAPSTAAPAAPATPAPAAAPSSAARQAARPGRACQQRALPRLPCRGQEAVGPAYKEVPRNTADSRTPQGSSSRK